MASTTHNIPPNVEMEYKILWTEVIRLHARWMIFLQLYGDPGSVDLLNRSAPGFFYYCQDALIDAVFTSICRLTDPASTGRKANLSLKHLIDEMKAYADGSLIAQLDTAFSTA